MATPTNDAVALIWARTAIRSGLAADLRLAAELSQAEVASQCGVTASAICRWESRQRMPRGAAAVRYAHFLAVLADTLAKKPVAA